MDALPDSFRRVLFVLLRDPQNQIEVVGPHRLFNRFLYGQGKSIGETAERISPLVGCGELILLFLVGGAPQDFVTIAIVYKLQRTFIGIVFGIQEFQFELHILFVYWVGDIRCEIQICRISPAYRINASIYHAPAGNADRFGSRLLKGRHLLLVPV